MDSIPSTRPLSRRSEILLITTSTIGGTILVVFIIYVLFQMRRGAALVDVLKLRRAGPRYTVHGEEYPIQWEQRFSVRSSHHARASHHPSTSLASRRQQRDLPPLPMPVTQKVLEGDAYYRWYWRDKARPTTPADAISSFFGRNPPTPSPTSTAKPEMAYSKKGRTSVRESTGRYSMMTSKSFKSCKTGKTNRTSKAPTVSVRDVSVDGSEPQTPTSITSRSKNRHTRWSWTNSEAPSTPKLHIDPKRSSTGSSSKYHPTRASGNYLMEAIEEDGITTVVSNSGLPAYTNSPDNKSKNSGGLRTFWNRNDSTS